MRPSLLPIALILAACTGGPGANFGEDLACEHDPHEWYDNPFASVLQGDGGEFDIDPYGEVVTSRVGTYDFETGDYGYATGYHADYPTIAASGEGYGTVHDDGDLDLITKVTYEDVLGERWAEQVRTRRTGCEGSVSRTELDLDAPVDAQPDEFADTIEWAITIVSDDEVAYRAEREEEYGLYVSDVSMSPDFANQGSYDYADGAYTGTTTMNWDGTGLSEWQQQGAAFGSDYDYIGSDQYYINGSRLTAYTVYTGGTTSAEAEVELLWLYDGSATGTYVIHDGGSTINCDVTITVGGEECTMYCSGYGTYDC